MATNTSIEWTDASWNPITGCSRVSEGCRHCYAERFAHRFSGEGQRYEGLTHIANGHPAWTGKILFSEKALLLPLSWRTPKRVFVNSMSDLFHENVTDEMRDKIFGVVALASMHTFQVLTKRPERMLAYAHRVAASKPDDPVNIAVFDGINAHRGGFASWPLPNVWLGVSVENQATADERIPLLLATPSAIRFISAEPLLGPVDLTAVACRDEHDDAVPSLDWVIVGGESGPGARPCDPEWIWSIVQQCKAASVPCFVKQLGSQHAAPGDSKGGDILFWPEHLRVRQFPEVRP